MSEQTQATLIEVAVWDGGRLPHYGVIDYSEGAEQVLATDEQLRPYVEACERYLATAEADGYRDPDTRIDYQVRIAVTMRVVETYETYERDGIEVTPGELVWSGMPDAVEQCRRER